MIDYFVVPTGDWQPWLSRVPQIDIEAHRITDTSTVIPTMDTVRHELLLNTWLNERKPLVLCGPPGSGKTMTLLSALRHICLFFLQYIIPTDRSLPDMDVINVNFSSSTTPELLMKNFDHYCEYRRTPNGVVLSPTQINRWLVIFCDEINLPNPDKYGTQRVISFMRQLVEQVFLLSFLIYLEIQLRTYRMDFTEPLTKHGCLLSEFNLLVPATHRRIQVEIHCLGASFDMSP